MMNYIIVNIDESSIASLHSSESMDGSFEFHMRLIVCWLYAATFMYKCIRGEYVRLIFEPKYITAKFKEEIPPGRTCSIVGFKSERVEKLWSNKNIIIRLCVAPLYALYIIMHTLVGTNVKFISSKNEDSYIPSELYEYSDDSIIVQEIIK